MIVCRSVILARHVATPYLQKRATMVACLRRVQRMSSDTHSMAESALAKIAEFRRLRYPINVLRKTCAYLGATTGEGAWINYDQRHTSRPVNVRSIAEDELATIAESRRLR